MRKFLFALLTVCITAFPVYADFPGLPPTGQGVSSAYDADQDNLIDASKGGTELDTSSSTGIPKIGSGTWSVLGYGAAGYCLKMNGTGDGLEWGACVAAGGDVSGPVSSTNNAIVLWDGTGGTVLKDSTYTITAAGAALIDDTDATAQRTTLGLGTMSTQAASGVAVTGGTATGVAVTSSSINGTSVGITTPASGKFTTITTTNETVLGDYAKAVDDVGLIWGTDMDYKSVYVSATDQMYFYTTKTGAAMTDANPMFVFQANSGNGTLDDEQTVFGIQDYNTSIFKVDEDGDVVATGTIQASSFSTSVSDGYHLINVLNTNGESFTEVEGDTYYDGTTQLWQTYDGANWRYGQHDAIEFIIDGGGSAITTGTYGHIEVPFACKIVSATALADQTGSIVVDVWVDVYGSFPPTDADSITASAPVTISSAQASKDTTLTGWDTALAAGDIISYNVDSITTIERVTISLKVLK